MTTIELTAFCLAVIGCFSLPSLLSLWLSRSRLHWLFQSLLVVALACPLTLIRAYDLLLIILVASFFVLIGSWVVQRRQRRKLDSQVPQTQKSLDGQPWFQFGLSDFVAAFVLMGSFAALLAKANQDNVWSEDVNTNLLAVVQCVLIGTAIATWSIALPVFRIFKYRFWLPWLAVLAATTVTAGLGLFTAKKLLQAWLLIFEGDIWALVNSPAITRSQSILGWTVVLSIHAVTAALIPWLFGVRSGARKADELTLSPSVKRKWRYCCNRLFGGAFVLLLGWSVVAFYVRLLPPTRYVPRRNITAGQPNCFSDLLKASLVLTDSNLKGYPPISPSTELAAELETFSLTFNEIELALNAENCFPVDWNSSQFDFDTVLNFHEIRTIARALWTRSLQALSEGRHDDVVKDGQLCFKLADRLTTDGVLVHSLVATAIEGIGVEIVRSGIDEASENRLNALAKQIDGLQQCHRSIDAEFDCLIEADNFFMWNNAITHWLDSLISSFHDVMSTYDSIRTSLVRRDTARELLRTEIAIILYRSAEDQMPETLDALVPEFINRVPKDQFSTTAEQPLQYIVSEDRQSYQLYSFGMDRDDDGGKIDESNPTEGDMDLKAQFGNRLANNAKEVKEYKEEEAERIAEEKEWEEGLDEMNGENYDDSYEPFEDSVEEVSPE